MIDFNSCFETNSVINQIEFSLEFFIIIIIIMHYLLLYLRSVHEDEKRTLLLNI